VVSNCAVRNSYLLPYLNDRFCESLHRFTAPGQFHVSEFAFGTLLEARWQQLHAHANNHCSQSHWFCRWPCIVAVFEPAQSAVSVPPVMPVPAPWIPLELDRKVGREKLRAFRCVECRRWRVRARWDNEADHPGCCVNCSRPMSVYSLV